MPKIDKKPFSIKGSSNIVYAFEMYTLDTDLPKKGGVYIFTRRYKDGKIYYHDYLYCGITDNFPDIYDNHPLEDALLEKNANCICIKIVNSAEVKNEVFENIMKANKFKCNLQAEKIG